MLVTSIHQFPKTLGNLLQNCSPRGRVNPSKHPGVTMTSQNDIPIWTRMCSKSFSLHTFQALVIYVSKLNFLLPELPPQKTTNSVKENLLKWKYPSPEFHFQIIQKNMLLTEFHLSLIFIKKKVFRFLMTHQVPKTL